MPSQFSKDIAYTLPSISINLLLWSSNAQLFRLQNKLVRTTLENTVGDVKELICIRSYEEQQQDNNVLINPECLTLIYKNHRPDNHVQLGSFINKNDDDPIRLQIQIDSKLLSYKDTLPSLINLNVHLSSGRVLHYRESLALSLRSLKNIVMEDLAILDPEELTSLNYLDGVELISETMSIGELLNADIIPSDSELNFYAVLKEDFSIKLSTPTITAVLKRYRVFVNFGTTILTVKQFIRDQYKGNYSIDVEDVKVIYFGRILDNSQKINDVITVLPNDPEANPITLHFVLKERQASRSQTASSTTANSTTDQHRHIPAEQQGNGGFWNDLGQGRLFEFLPREPNPNFEEEVRRDELLRQRLRNVRRNASDTESNPQLSQQHTVVETLQQDPQLPPLDRDRNLSYTSTSSLEYPSSQPRSSFIPNQSLRPTPTVKKLTVLKQKPHPISALTTSFSLNGDSFDTVVNSSQPTESITINQAFTSSELYTITVNNDTFDERSVTLTTSQCQINTHDSENPYLMVSPSGLAKLYSLGVRIDIPDIELIDEEDADLRANRTRQFENEADLISERILELNERVRSVNEALDRHQPSHQNINGGIPFFNGHQANANEPFRIPNIGLQADNLAANPIQAPPPNVIPFMGQFQQLRDNIMGNPQNANGGNVQGAINADGVALNFQFDFGFIFTLFKLGLVYYIATASISPTSFWLNVIIQISCILFFLTRAQVRPIINWIYRGAVPQDIRDRIDGTTGSIYGFFFRDQEELVGLYDQLLNFRDQDRNSVLQCMVIFGIHLSLFVLTLIPDQFAAFKRAIDQRERIKRESQEQNQAHARELENRDQGNVLGTVDDVNAVAEPAVDEPEELETQAQESTEEDPEIIEEEIGATGNQPHHGN